MRLHNDFTDKFVYMYNFTGEAGIVPAWIYGGVLTLRI